MRIRSSLRETSLGEMGYKRTAARVREGRVRGGWKLSHPVPVWDCCVTKWRSSFHPADSSTQRQHPYPPDGPYYSPIRTLISLQLSWCVVGALQSTGTDSCSFYNRMTFPYGFVELKIIQDGFNERGRMDCTTIVASLPSFNTRIYRL